MNQKKSTPVYLSETEKSKIERMASNWGCSQSSAIKRLISEAPDILAHELLNPAPVMVDVKSFDLSMLPSLVLIDYLKLPTKPGVYIVLDGRGSIKYVGKAAGKNGLKGRWGKRRAIECIDKGGVSLRFIVVNDKKEAANIEGDLIRLLKPEWNVNGSWATQSRERFEEVDYDGLAAIGIKW